jgi:hypothetical protein
MSVEHGNSEIKAQFDEKEQCSAAVASITLQSFPYQKIEEIHHNARNEDDEFPVKRTSKEVEEWYQRYHSLQGETYSQL